MLRAVSATIHEENRASGDRNGWEHENGYKARGMKSLFLLRHAKSSWANPGLDDFDRPLNARGEKAAPKMAAYMRTHGLVPDLVLCSTARRAEQTWDLIDRSLDAGMPVKRLRGLYLASPSRLLEIIRRQSDAVARLLVVAHNPGMEVLAAALAGPGSDPGHLATAKTKFPTAALAVIRFDDDGWSGLSPGSGRLVDFAVPRLLA